MSDKALRLNSIAGAEPMEYSWPLTIGRGSMRGAEDEHDQASEIVESIKWVGVDWPEVMEDMGDLLGSYDRHDWDAMNNIVDTYNKSVDRMVKSGQFKDRLDTRTSRQMLRHVLQQVYNKAISDPNELNHYEPFTPEVYGETSFELINQMIDQISPITSENKFLDLGSGVGQVVLQVAALTDCQLCVGVEKAIIPSGRAVEMDTLFKKWMAWYGKKYSPYKLYQGDFLTPEHRKTISDSTIVFVNNYAFGPEVDHMLKERFADLKDGARIVSSKPFCPLNFRITERNLSDIGTIMHVSVMDPLQGSVSWTDKPVSYYLHIIDSTKLERYFNRQQSHHTRSRRTGHSLLDMDSASNGSVSRASSLEKELDSPQAHLSTASGEESDTGVRGRGRGRGRSKKKFTKKKSTPRTDGRVAKVTNFLNQLEGKEPAIEEVETTPDTSVPPSRADSPQNSDSPDTPAGSTGRPVRAAVVNAAAITEAQNDIYANIGRRTSKMRGRGKYKHLNEGDRLPRPLKTGPKKVISKRASPPTGLISELDLMHQETMNKITEYNESETLPTGCTNEALNILPPETIFHEEVPFHVHAGDEKIPHGLHILLETMKKQYLSMIQTMQSKEYSDNIKEEIEREKDRKENLQKRIKQLENQIDGLIQDSLGLLKARIRELGINASTPTEFTEQAKNIVCSHADLLKKKGGLEQEIKRLEQEQDQLVQSKEKELFEQLLSQKSGGDVNVAELKQYVQREIRSCFDARNHIPKLSSDVTLTKVGAPEKLQEKEKDLPSGLPKMELKLPGENSFTLIRSEERNHSENRGRDSDSRSRSNDNHAELTERTKMGAPKTSDDYEDRVKMIITAELAKEKESEKHTSPTKDQKQPSHSQEQRRRPVQQRSRPPSNPRQQSGDRHGGDHRHTPDGRPGSDPRQQLDARPGSDPRQLLDARPGGDPRQLLDARPGSDPRQLLDARPGSDPRQLLDARPGSDPRQLLDARPGSDPRQLLDARPGSDPRHMMDPRPGSDPRHMMDPRPGSDPRQMMDPRPGSDPRHMMDPRPGSDPRHMMDVRPGSDPRQMMESRPGSDPRQLLDPRHLGDPRQAMDPRLMDPRIGDPRLDPRHRLGPDGRMQSFQDNRHPHDMRINLEHGRALADPRLVSPHESAGRPPPDPRLVSPHDPRIVSPHEQRRADSRSSNPDMRTNNTSSGSSYHGDRQPFPDSNRGFPPQPDSSRPPFSEPHEVPRTSYSGDRFVSSTSNPPASSSSLHISSQQLMSMTVEKVMQNQSTPVSSNASRMSMIIEESVRREAEKEQRRNVYSTVVKSGDMMEGLACPRGTNSPQERKPGTLTSLPQVEGLAARFDSYFEKASKEKTTSRGGSLNTSGEGLGARFSSPDMIQSQSRPTSTSSKSSLHTPDPAQQESGGNNQEKKRSGSPLLSPGGKRPNLEEEPKKKDPDDTRRWQDEISMGFERLVAMASEVDKRRKSAENSPAHNSPSRKTEGSKESPRTSSDIRMLQESNPYDQQTLANKIRAGLMQQGATSSAPPTGNSRTPDSGTPRSSANTKVEQTNLPGENLPEHHFKKKYFNQEYQRQQEETLRSRDKVDDGARSDYHRGGGGGYDQARWEGERANLTYEQRMQMERQRVEQRHLQERAYYEAARGDPRSMMGHVDGRGGGGLPRGGAGPPRQMYHGYGARDYGPDRGQRMQGPPSGPQGQMGPGMNPQVHPGMQGPMGSGPQGQGPQAGYHYNPQMMQAMSYRHQMMYGPRPPQK